MDTVLYEQDEDIPHVESTSAVDDDLIEIRPDTLTRWRQASGKSKTIALASIACIACMLSLLIIALVNASTGCLDGVGSAVAIIVFVMLLSGCLFVVLWLGVAKGWTR